MNKYFSNENVAYEVYTNEEVIYCRANGCFSLFPVCSIPSIGYMLPQELKEEDYCFTYWKIFPLKERWTEKEAVIFCKNKVRMQMESKKAQLLRMLLTREKVIIESIEKEITNSNKHSATVDYSNHELARKIERNLIDKVHSSKSNLIPLEKGEKKMEKDTILKIEVITSDNRKITYDTPAQVSIDTWCCGTCHKTLDPDWEYCPYCGNCVKYSESGRFKSGVNYTR